MKMLSLGKYFTLSNSSRHEPKSRIKMKETFELRVNEMKKKVKSKQQQQQMKRKQLKVYKRKNNTLDSVICMQNIDCLFL